MSAVAQLSEPFIQVDQVPHDHTYFQSPEDYERLNLAWDIPQIIGSLQEKWKIPDYHEDRNPLVIQYWLGEVDHSEAVRAALLRDDSERFETIQKRLFKNYQKEEQAKLDRQVQELRDTEYAKSFRCEAIGRIAACLGCNSPKCTYPFICAASLLIGFALTPIIWSGIRMDFH